MSLADTGWAEHRGILPHHTSPPQRPEEFAEFCTAMLRRYADQISVPRRAPPLPAR